MTSALSVAERKYPTSEVRGRSQEDPMPEGWRPRGVTLHPRSGAVAQNARLQRCRNGQEELPKSKVRGSGREEIPRERGQGWRPGGATLCPRPRAAARRTNTTPNARSSGREDQGAVDAWEQEGLEEVSHVEGQEGRR